MEMGPEGSGGSCSQVTVGFTEQYLASRRFDAFFAEGMGLVERAASYLEGVGRDDSKTLPRTVAMCYAAQSMRLTTRLMQLASWLLLQRAVKQGELSRSQAQGGKGRVRFSPQMEPQFSSDFALLPVGLRRLVGHANRLIAQACRFEADLGTGTPKAADNPVIQQQLALGAAVEHFAVAADGRR